MSKSAVLALLLSSGVVLAADANKPHPHRGVVEAYSGAPAPLQLTSADLATLAAGEPVRKQVQMSSGGRGVAVMDVKAPAKMVWAKIGDYASYPDWVDNLNVCEIYQQDANDVRVRFEVSAFGLGAEWFIRHNFQPAKGYITWTLDYDRESDLDDSVGYWRVKQLESEPPLTRVEYSVDVRVTSFVPGFVEDMLVKNGLETATSWVKEQAEQDYKAKK